MRILRSAGYRAMPWKNGRGVTRQVAAHPADADYDSLDWQVSRTEIGHDTPFSKLVGLDRQFMLVSGNGVILRVRSAEDGVEFEQRIDWPLEPFAFRGDWDVDCALVGDAVEVLNVMTRRGRAAARIERREISPPTPVRKSAGGPLLVYAADPLSAYGAWGEDGLRADDAILVDEAETTEIALAAAGNAMARVVLIRLDRT